MSNITVRGGFSPATLGEAMEFSKMLSESNMVPKAYQGKPGDIMVCVQWGMELGLAPLQAMQNIAVINGKPSVWGDALIAMVQASHVCEDIEEWIEGEGTPNPVAICVAKRKGRSPVTAKFSVDDARRAGLYGKPGPWTQYPQRMLKLRARGFALRDAFPDVLKGMITAEEAQDYPEAAQPAIKDIPKNPLDAIAPPKPIEETYEVLEVEDDKVDADTPEPEAEAAVLDAEVVEVQDTATVDVEEAASPSVAQETGSEWTLSVPGKEPVPYGTMDTWLVEYNKLADQMAQTGKLSPTERIKRIKSLREVNDQTIKRLHNTIRVVLTQGHQTRLIYLQEKEREETGKPDNIRSDNGLQRQA